MTESSALSVRFQQEQICLDIDEAYIITESMGKLADEFLREDGAIVVAPEEAPSYRGAWRPLGRGLGLILLSGTITFFWLRYADSLKALGIYAAALAIFFAVWGFAFIKLTFDICFSRWSIAIHETRRLVIYESCGLLGRRRREASFSDVRHISFGPADSGENSWWEATIYTVSDKQLAGILSTDRDGAKMWATRVAELTSAPLVEKRFLKDGKVKVAPFSESDSGKHMDT